VSFGQLQLLTRLNLFENHLKTLPASFLVLSSLRNLEVANNALDSNAKMILKTLLLDKGVNIYQYREEQDLSRIKAIERAMKKRIKRLSGKEPI